jgi:hypothetical protein
MSDLDSLHSKFQYLLVFNVKVLGEKMERDSMIGCNDKIVLKNKLNVSECRIFECREFKSLNDL